MDFKKYSENIKKFLKIHHCKIIFEPGRSIVGDSGVLITKIIYIKEGQRRHSTDKAIGDQFGPKNSDSRGSYQGSEITA